MKGRIFWQILGYTKIFWQVFAISKYIVDCTAPLHYLVGVPKAQNHDITLMQHPVFVTTQLWSINASPYRTKDFGFIVET